MFLFCCGYRFFVFCHCILLNRYYYRYFVRPKPCESDNYLWKRRISIIKISKYFPVKYMKISSSGSRKCGGYDKECFKWVCWVKKRKNKDKKAICYVSMDCLIVATWNNSRNEFLADILISNMSLKLSLIRQKTKNRMAVRLCRTNLPKVKRLSGNFWKSI